jgi:cytochrome c biogenesis factor
MNLFLFFIFLFYFFILNWQIRYVNYIFILFTIFVINFELVSSSIVHLNSNIYLYLLNKLSIWWSINELYLYIQLVFSIFIVYILLLNIFKKQLFILPSSFLFIQLVNCLLFLYYYFPVEYLNYLHTYFNSNIILSHSLVSIHPPLILIIILFIRLFSNIFISNLQLVYSFIQNKYYLFYYYIFFFILTFAIILGSFWSINLFGWGGWWIWDPIENISFIYWLFFLILLHFRQSLFILLLWHILLLLIDYIFFCSFKLNLLLSLHIFKNVLFILNINYFYYVLFFFFFYYFIHILFNLINSNIFFTSNLNNFLLFICIFLFIFYFQHLILNLFLSIIYSNQLLNLIFISLIYILLFILLPYLKLFYIHILIYILTLYFIYCFFFQFAMFYFFLILFFLYIFFTILTFNYLFFIHIHIIFLIFLFFLLFFATYTINTPITLNTYLKIDFLILNFSIPIVYTELVDIGYLISHLKFCIDSIEMYSSSIFINYDFAFLNIAFTTQKNELLFLYTIFQNLFYNLFFNQFSIFIVPYLNYLLLICCITVSSLLFKILQVVYIRWYVFKYIIL